MPSDGRILKRENLSFKIWSVHKTEKSYHKNWCTYGVTLNNILK